MVVVVVVVVVSRRRTFYARREIVNVLDVCRYDAPLNGT